MRVLIRVVSASLIKLAPVSGMLEFFVPGSDACVEYRLSKIQSEDEVVLTFRAPSNLKVPPSLPN